jgi:hypothetical protein
LTRAKSIFVPNPMNKEVSIDFASIKTDKRTGEAIERQARLVGMPPVEYFERPT